MVAKISIQNWGGEAEGKGGVTPLGTPSRGWGAHRDLGGGMATFMSRKKAKVPKMVAEG